MAIPRVLVIGGGIAGMQAALDVADAGYQVYLVERRPWIGGHMAQLDKTFPTNDCAMCTISPKLTEVGQHPNVELFTHSEVIGLEGKPGEFRVRIRRLPRYVDSNKCNACGECANVCPVTLPNEFDQGLGVRKAIYKAYPQGIPNAMAITKGERPPCVMACPAGINVQGYVALTAAGKFKEAFRLIWEKNPLPSVCGRVCYHPCEASCNRNQIDEAVGINSLKRFLSDWARGQGVETPKGTVDPSKPKVAVVGSGPAGLTAARDLALMGYPVTIFEAKGVLGGMLVQAIPPYRLPREALQEDLRRILDLGVEVRTGVRVGKDLGLDDLRAQGFEAVFLALGMPKGQRLGVEGEGLEGVWPALDFLRRVNLGDPPKVEGTVAVIGGGNTAIDAARTALRLGAERVRVLYRRTEKEMPASPEEVEEAREEGVEFEFLVAPVRLVDEGGRVTAVELLRMRLGEPDESGRARPEPIPGSEFLLEARMVIVAVGQAGDLDWAQEVGLEVTPRGTLKVDPLTLQTSVPYVFAGGDVVTGPSFVVEAIRAGHEAATSIDRYLRGEDLRARRGARDLPVSEVPRGAVHKVPRKRPQKLPPGERRHTFAEVVQGLSAEDAQDEARRCLNCGMCCECFECVRVCEQKAIDHQMGEEVIELEVGAIIVAVGYDLFDPREKPELGYGRLPGVLTGLELERLMSSSGPTGGEIRVGGKVPRRFVFIHCVGSRDHTVNRPYCSRFCCMYTAKQASEVMERVHGAEVRVCYMDVRAYGKGYEGLYERVQRKGVLYTRGIPSEVFVRDGAIVVRGEDTLTGRPYEWEVDVVVLACGARPPEGVEGLAQVLGLELDSNGFFKEANPLDPVLSPREGIFLAGCCQGPRDISDTVAMASGAAARALAYISKVRG